MFRLDEDQSHLWIFPIRGIVLGKVTGRWLYGMEKAFDLSPHGEISQCGIKDRVEMCVLTRVADTCHSGLTTRNSNLNTKLAPLDHPEYAGHG